MEQALPAVSVVIPAYRQAEHIAGCLDSVAAQDYAGPVEIIVVDDGSPDDVAARARAHPSSPLVLRQPNAGPSAARNTGIDAASGLYVAFLDADDRWHPEKITAQVGALQRLQRPALSFCRYQRLRQDGRPAGMPTHPPAELDATARRLVRQGNFIGCSTAVVHRDCFARVGCFPDSPNLRRAGQDYALWLRIAAYFPLVYVPRVLVDYAVHETNRVGTDPLKHFEGAVSALRSFHAAEPDRLQAIAGLPLRGLLTLRAGRLLADAARYRDHFPPDTLQRLGPLLLDALRPG